MPYHQVYYPAPKDMSLPVLQELPATAHKWPFRDFEAFDDTNNTNYTFCRRSQFADDAKQKEYEKLGVNLGCGGWIPRPAYQAQVNTLDGRQLAGRRGTEWFCPRCGREIYFEGMMS